MLSIFRFWNSGVESGSSAAEARGPETHFASDRRRYQKLLDRELSSKGGERVEVDQFRVELWGDQG